MVKKSKKCVADMAKSIAERFVERRGNRRRVHCGIVYCLSRKQCEDIAGQLEVRLSHDAGFPASQVPRMLWRQVAQVRLQLSTQI